MNPILDLTANLANVMSRGTIDFHLVESSCSISWIHGFGHQDNSGACNASSSGSFEFGTSRDLSFLLG